jgi:uncharacterized protein
MQADELVALNRMVLGAAFALSLVFGAIAHRTQFCTMGAVSDIVNMGEWTRMRQWAMAVGVAMIGFAVLAYTGQIQPTKTLYYSTRFLWLSALVGGLMFGFGMVLSSGCGSKSLVRFGAGSLKSLVVLIVMAAAGFATLKGITAVVRVASVDRIAVEMPQGANLPGLVSDLVGTPVAPARLLLGVLVGLGLLMWALRTREGRQSINLFAGFGIGAAVVGMWWVSGHLGYVAEHPETLEEFYVATNSGRVEAMSFVAPLSYTLDWLMFFSDKNKVISLGIASVMGVVCGAALDAIRSRRFRLEGFAGTEDLANHLMGAALMGVGGVTALGCTVGQGLSGLSTLSLTSFVAVAGIIAGAVLALKYQIWRLDRMS